MNTLTFHHSGQIGDILYSIPTILSILERCNQMESFVAQEPIKADLILGLRDQDYFSLFPLLKVQPQIHGVFQVGAYDIPRGAMNLDKFRLSARANTAHIVNKHLDAFELPDLNFNKSKPWLRVPVANETMQELQNMAPYAVVNVTPRYRDRFFNWRRELSYLEIRVKHLFFVGLYHEYTSFVQEFHLRPAEYGLQYFPTNDMLVAAQMISNAKYFSGNQSSMLAVRQALHLPYRFEQSPNHVDCHQGSSHETVLNPWSRKVHKFLVSLKELSK